MESFEWQEFWEDMKGSVLGYFKAQLKVFVAQFLILLLGFILLDYGYWSILIALGIAIFDFFPIFDSGIILIPWGIIELVQNDIRTGVGLIVLWLVVELICKVLEVKLVGDELEIPLWLTLLVTVGSVFVMGPVGPFVSIILLPVLAVIRRRLGQDDF